MTRKEILDTIRAHKNELNRMGVRSLALFGSGAREQMDPGSDIDLLVEFEKTVGLFRFFEVQQRLEELLGTAKVDLVVRDAVIEELKGIIYKEAIPCFPESGRSASVTY